MRSCCLNRAMTWCVAVPRQRFNALPGERLGAAGFHLPVQSKNEASNRHSVSFVQSASQQVLGGSQSFFWGPCLCEAPLFSPGAAVVGWGNRDLGLCAPAQLFQLGV